MTIPPQKKSRLIKPVIEPGCIACGSCQFIVPEVFTVTDRSRVSENADFRAYEELIRKAAAACPVKVIALQEE